MAPTPKPDSVLAGRQRREAEPRVMLDNPRKLAGALECDAVSRIIKSTKV